MFGSLGFPELMFIFVIALILFGPRQLPKIGQSLGRALGEFRRASNEFKRTVEEEIAADEIRQVEKDLRKVADPLTADKEKEASSEPSGVSAAEPHQGDAAKPEEAAAKESDPSDVDAATKSPAPPGEEAESAERESGGA